MSEVSFRNFSHHDLTRCAELAVDAWPIASVMVLPEDTTKLMCGYVEIGRLSSTRLELAYVNGEIAGFIFGRVACEVKLVDELIAAGSMILMGIRFLFDKYGRISRPLTFLQKFFATERKAKLHAPSSEAEVVLFVVSSAHRGRGIGRMLLERLIEHAKSKGAKTVSLYTDPLSNWKFYEKMGFQRYHTFEDDLHTYFNGKITPGFVYSKAV